MRTLSTRFRAVSAATALALCLTFAPRPATAFLNVGSFDSMYATGKSVGAALAQAFGMKSLELVGIVLFLALAFDPESVPFGEMVRRLEPLRASLADSGTTPEAVAWQVMALEDAAVDTTATAAGAFIQARAFMTAHSAPGGFVMVESDLRSAADGAGAPTALVALGIRLDRTSLPDPVEPLATSGDYSSARVHVVPGSGARFLAAHTVTGLVRSDGDSTVWDATYDSIGRAGLSLLFAVPSGLEIGAHELAHVTVQRTDGEGRLTGAPVPLGSVGTLFVERDVPVERSGSERRTCTVVLAAELGRLDPGSVCP